LGIIVSKGKEYLNAYTIDNLELVESQAFDALTSKILSSLRTFGLPNRKIKLKVGTSVTLLRNLDQLEGLCNGS